MPADAAFDADVAIVGYGPTGALLAILLAQRGWRVEVLERWPEPYPLPRAVHFDHEVGRILQSAGVTGRLSGRTEPASVYEWRNAAGDTLLRIGRDPTQSLSGWPESNMFHQPELEAILDARARELPALRVRRGCELTALEATPDGVALRAGEERTLCARYAVGCDGANSRVREALGAGWHDLGFHFDWLVADLVLHDAARVFEPTNWQLCDPARPTTIVSGGPGRRRFEFMRLPGEHVDELEREETVWRLLAPWDVHPGNAKLVRHTVYGFRACWADVWRRGRVLLAGDAAHLMPPFAGQGMCSGARDAINLAWKLDLVLAGRAPDALLDSYASERMPHVRATIELSIALGELICVADPAAAAERDARMTAQAQKQRDPLPAPLAPLGPGCLADAPCAGELFVQPRLREGWLDDVVGARFALIAPEGDPAGQLDAERAAWFASQGGVCVSVDDADGRTVRWFRERGVAVALQRPDFQVFGAARELAGAAGLVDALRERLGMP